MCAEKKKSDQFFCAALDVVTRLCEGQGDRHGCSQTGQGSLLRPLSPPSHLSISSHLFCAVLSDVAGELYAAGVCGVLDQVLGLKMGSNLCCESCLRALCSMLCAKVSRLRPRIPFWAIP